MGWERKAMHACKLPRATNWKPARSGDVWTCGCGQRWAVTFSNASSLRIGKPTVTFEPLK